MLLSGMTHSGVESFRRCRKKFWFDYRAGGHGVRTLHQPVYYDIGSAYHKAMEFIGRVWIDRKSADIGEIIGNGIADEIQGYVEVCGTRLDELTKALVLAHARGLAYAHADYLVAKCQDVEFVAVEKDFETEIDGEPIHGRVDAIATQGGRTWLVEHKALSSVDDSFIDTVSKDAQVLRYIYALRKMGYPISGVLYTVGVKCRLQHKKSETDAEFVQRISADYEEKGVSSIHHFQVIIDRGDVERCVAGTKETLTEIKARDESKVWTKFESGCENRYGRCEFYPICMKQEWSENNELLPGFVLKRPKHQ